MRRLYTAQRRAGADPETTLLIADRWRWGGFLFPLLWALWNRHWLAALGLGALAFGLGALGEAGLGALAALAEVAVRLIVGFEGAALARLDRRLRGWREEGAVLAWDDDDAEARWFGARAQDAPSSPQSGPHSSPSRRIEPVVRGPWGPREEAPT